MGWGNPPVSWRELEGRLSWNGTRLPAQPAGTRAAAPPPGSLEPGGDEPVPWAELHCHSSYSFLDGASSPAELAAEAGRRGVPALAIHAPDALPGAAPA